MLDGLNDSGDKIEKWAAKSKRDNFTVFCHLCQKVINVSLRGKKAILEHSQGKMHKHKAAINRKKDGELQIKVPNIVACFSKNRETPPSRSFEDDVVFSEGLWAAATARHNLPYMLSDSMTKLFPVMFSDSKIAKKFQCRRNKTSPIISDAMGPYFKEKIENEIRNSQCYTIEIDEATTAAHWRQFDIHVRFLSENQGRVVVNFLDSFKLGRS